MTRRGLFLSALIAPFAGRFQRQTLTLPPDSIAILTLTPQPKPFLRIALEGFSRFDVTFNGETRTFTPEQIWKELE